MGLIVVNALLVAVTVGAVVMALGYVADRWLCQSLGLEGKPDAELSDFDRAMARAMRDEDEALY